MSDLSLIKQAQQDLSEDPQYALALADRRQNVARLAETLSPAVLSAVESAMGIKP